jgi:hypothetical protein
MFEPNNGRRKKMLVVVDNKYTYACDFQVEIGDKVYLPAPFFSEKCWIGEITALTSEYQGEVRKIIGVVRKDTDKKNG